MEFVEEPNPPIRPLPGFTQSENEALFKEVKATMMDLAENAKSKRVRDMCKRELRDRRLISEEPKPEPAGQTLADNKSLLNSIHIPEEQIEYLKKVALEAGEDIRYFK